MLATLRVNQQLKQNYGPEKVAFVLDPYLPSRGPIRQIQKFTVLLLTTVGTDKIRPWLGTKLPLLCRMNVINSAKLQLFIREQVNTAISQFFRLQADEQNLHGVNNLDSMRAIELLRIDVNELNQYSVTILFTPTDSAALVYSIAVRDTDHLHSDLTSYSIVEYKEWQRKQQSEE